MRPRPLLTAAALLATADTAIFLVQRRRIFRTAPGRAGGSVALLALWSTLATRAAYGRRDASTLGLAVGAAAASFALLGIHLRHGIAGPRVFLGAGLGAAALAGALRDR